MRTRRYVLGVYVIGAISMAIYLVWSAIDGGALEQQHHAHDWLLIAIFYATYCALWPAVLGSLLLIYIGIQRGPIEVESQSVLFLMTLGSLIVLTNLVRLFQRRKHANIKQGKAAE